MTKTKSALETAMFYKEMEKITPQSSMYREVRLQYIDMANGGNGGELGFTPVDYTGPNRYSEYGPSCREYNYPSYPDAFFQEVCALMGWMW
tara:strand:- start:527 stop:799 length:273 start_codon:yes stop_codon:yes gene_type:complete